MTKGGAVNFTYMYETIDSLDEIEEIELSVEAKITDYHPAVCYQRNGVPGCPEEGGEVEDLTVTLPDGTDMDPIPEALYDALESKAREQDYEQDGT